MVEILKRYITVSRILFVEEKHGNRFFDASTDELLYAASLKIVRERLKRGWYYDRIYDTACTVDQNDDGAAAWKFLTERNGELEYENVRLVDLESA